jgi:hypothetical protein
MDTLETIRIVTALLAKSEQVIAACDRRLDRTDRLPTTDELKTVRRQLDAETVKLTKIIREQPDAVKSGAKSALVRAHRALKLLGDDLFLVDLEVARTLPSNSAIPPTPEDLARKTYNAFLRAWVGASPIIHPDTAKRLWPKVSNLKKLGSVRSMLETLDFRDSDSKPPSPVELARDALKRELRRVISDPKVVGLGDDTVHLIGMAYVLAQIELALRFDNDQSFQQSVAGWYESAKRPMSVILEMVGCFDRELLEWTRDGDPFAVQKLQDARRDLLGVLARHYSLPDWACATLAGFPKAGGLPTEIVGVNGITEKTTQREKIIFNDNPTNRDEMLGYLADTGFPLIYPRRGEKPATKPPQRFGSVPRPVVARARRQAVEYMRQIRFSVSEAVAEQLELIADLVALDTVRDSFKRTIKKNPVLNLMDRATRGTAFAAAMKSFAPTLSPDEALLPLIEFVRRYLHYFTRHTGDNMRDRGKPYLSSAWPTDLTGRQFFDCGIYAVETAFDLMRIANAAKGMTLKFRFLLIPEHVALVVYHEKTTFCVNNADIENPRPVQPRKDDPEAFAGLRWAEHVTQPLYDAKFAIIVAALTPTALSSRTSEARFKSAIWTMYQSVMGFGVTLEVSQEFFQTLKSFDAGNALLCGYLIELLQLEDTRATPKERAASLDAATALAGHLYGMIEMLANPIVYSDDNGIGFKATVVAHVSVDNALVQRTRLGRRLPVYRFIEFLNEAGITPNAVQKKLMDRKVGSAHLDDLNAALEAAGERTSQDYETLKGRFAAARAGVDQFINNAPRIEALINRP